MIENEKEGIDPAVVETERQAPALREFLRAINAAQKQLSMYGAEHPNTLESLCALAQRLDEFMGDFDRATCVFTKDVMIVNDRQYPATNDSRELFQRLRARGVMAITFVGASSGDQMGEFLSFLNVEPRQVRQQGGPSVYLRKHGVSHIVATAAVYTGSDEADDEREAAETFDANSVGVDRAIGAVIGWLSKQDEDQEEAQRLPITEILSHPDMAAKLIREAVTKLHDSRKKETAGELATEVIHDLKELAVNDPTKWDNATPQIRKAISKLTELRPEARGFAPGRKEPDNEPAASAKVVDTGQVEAMVANAIDSQSKSDAIKLRELNGLFDTKVTGLASKWRSELEPSGFISSSGMTLVTLMEWENRPAEHSRIANALAGLIPRAIEARDMESVTLFTETLSNEANKPNELDWRRSNARSALQSIEHTCLRQLVEDFLKNGGYRAKDVAGALVRAVPSLAVHLVDLLGIHNAESFNEALRQGMIESKQAAVEPLTRLLGGQSATAREAALEILAEIGSMSAIRAIADVMDTCDVAFIIKALEQLSKMPSPLAVEACAKKLSHQDPGARGAALSAMGKMGVGAGLPHIVRIATRSAFLGGDVSEKAAAIEALGRVGGPEELPCLDKMANARPLIGRNRYEAVKTAARQAAAEIRTRAGITDARAA
ncbi:MAG: hypothetical protein Q7N50_03985 [Armatimonadota bacterium]|nr:hypothetical protein [Armatimonadota bacterium]